MMASYKELKARISMTMVLERYIDDVPTPSEGSAQLRLPCPICQSEKNSLSVNVQKNLFRCFRTECKSAGNILNFVATMEKTDIPGAGKLLTGRYCEKETTEGPQTAPESPEVPVPEQNPIRTNTPLTFEFRNVDCGHGSLANLGIQDPERFGVGY